MKKIYCLSITFLACNLAYAEPSRDLLRELLACQEISDPAARVACYDPVVSRLADETQLDEPVEYLAETDRPQPPREVADRTPAPQPELAPRTATEPDWAQAPAPTPERDADAPRSFDAVVVRIARLNSGRHLFFTEDGAIWEQTQDVRVNLPTSLPARVEFTRRLTGNPMISFEGTRAGYRVRRIE